MKCLQALVWFLQAITFIKYFFLLFDKIYCLTKFTFWQSLLLVAESAMREAAQQDDAWQNLQKFTSASLDEKCQYSILLLLYRYYYTGIVTVLLLYWYCYAGIVAVVLHN